MSLTIGQANSVNEVAKHLLDSKPGAGTPAAHIRCALISIGPLIEAAYKSLAAGYSPTGFAEARAAWEKRIGVR